MYKRAVVHMDLDSFFVSVERLRNSAFNGKPLIIGGSSNRGVVASCSYEARKFGVHSAMPVKMARYLCPDAIFIRGDMDAYSKQSELVTQVIAEEAPLYEKASIDEFYLDLTGMDRHFGCYLWGKELRQKIIRETGLPISFGLSVNKMVSKVGTGEAKPNGSIQITAGTEKSFLHPLPINKLPGVGKKTSVRLTHMGVRKIATLSQIPPDLLTAEFGKNGRKLWEKANGIDDSPITPYIEQKSMSSERTFEQDSLDIKRIKSILARMTGELAYELRTKEKLTSCITVKIRYADFNTFTRQKKITYTSGDKKLCAYADKLFDELYTRRQMIRLIGVRFSDMLSSGKQLNLFEDELKEDMLLERMDAIRQKFGKNVLQRASWILPQSTITHQKLHS
ncbi:MAG: DNA polymerase IV [Saprospirales bacterium]|nr:MAG: DNA polymerase IV [Saprospirales bacterium]